MLPVALFVFLLIVIIVVIYLKTPAAKGHISERAVARRLNKDCKMKQSGKILTNVYIPKTSGDTAEIDILYITRKGLLVIENKNYAGYIFGKESNKSWTVTLYAGKSRRGNKVEKHPFYNPVWQNRNHIQSLKEYLRADIKAFSIITFSNRGDLKSIDVRSPDVFVRSHAELSTVIRQIWDENTDVLTDGQIEEIHNKLSPLTNTTRETKQKHIAQINRRFNNTQRFVPFAVAPLFKEPPKKDPIWENNFTDVQISRNAGISKICESEQAMPAPISLTRARCAQRLSRLCRWRSIRGFPGIRRRRGMPARGQVS